MAISAGAAAAIAAVTAVVSAASTAYVSIKQNQANQESQEEYNDYLNEQAIKSYAELDKQEVDVIQESYKESLESQKQYLKARSSVDLQAAATGTYGQSIDLALEDLNTGLGQRMGDITATRESRLDNIDIEAKNAQESVKANADYTLSKPSWFSGVSNGVSAFASTYNTASSTLTTYRNSKKAV
jgi:hypothetical protein